MVTPSMHIGQSSRPKVELDETRRKKLMRRLHLIKLNKSRGNRSLFEYNESKCRKLKINNIALAKSLADLKQEAATWYNQYVAMKASNQDAEEKLLRYQSMENGNFDRIVDVEVQNRIGMLAKHMESAVDSTMGDARSMLDNLAECKRIVGCLSNIGKNTVLSSHLMNSRGSSGSRPPLCKNGAPKSPRKNVVHPMVGGYVMQPATICLPRVSLEDRYRYRLQERAERFEEQASNNLSTVNEQSSLLVDNIDSNSAEDTDQESSDEGNATPLEVEEQLISPDSSTVSESNIETIRNQSLAEENVTGFVPSPCIDNSLSNRLSSSLISVKSSADTPNSSLQGIQSFKDDSKSLSCSEDSQNGSIALPTCSSHDNLCESQNSSPIRLNDPHDKSIHLPSAKNSPESLPLKTKSARLLKRSKQGTICTEDPLGNENISSPTNDVSKALPLKTKSARILKNSLCRIKDSHKETDDPLEGPSWLHINKKKGGKNKRKKSNFTLVKPNVVRLVLESCSDCSDDESDFQTKNKRNQQLSVPRSTALCLSPSKKERALVINDSSPLKPPPQTEHEEMYHKVGRRSKKKSKLNSLESFIVIDPLEDDNKKCPTPRKSRSSEKELESLKMAAPSSIPISFPLSLAFINNTNNPSLVHEKECIKMTDITCFLNSSMEITECISNSLKSLIKPEENVKESSKCLDIQDTAIEDISIPNKPNKFFKCIENGEIESKVSANLPEKTPFDVSLLEPSFFVNQPYEPVKKGQENLPAAPSLNLSECSPIIIGKENVPPLANSPDADDDIKHLKNVSIVIQDILKSPLTEENEVHVSKPNSGRCKRKNLLSKKEKVVKSKKPRSQKVSPKLNKSLKVSRKKGLSHNCSRVEEMLDTEVKTRLKRKTKPKKDPSELSNVNKPNSRQRKVLKNLSPDLREKITLKRKNKKSILVEPSMNLSLVKLEPECIEKWKSVQTAPPINECSSVEGTHSVETVKIGNLKNMQLQNLKEATVKIKRSDYKDFSQTSSPSMDCSSIDDAQSANTFEIGNLKNRQLKNLKEATVKLKRSDDKDFSPTASPNNTIISTATGNNSFSPCNILEENIQYISSTSSSSTGFEGFTTVENTCLEKITALPKLLSKTNNRPTSPKDVIKNVLSELNNASPKSGSFVFTTDEIYVKTPIVDLEEDNEIIELECEEDPLSNNVEPIPREHNECEAYKIVNLHLLEELNKNTVDVIDEIFPRKRRAASKIISFKEPTLNKKMRQDKVKEKIIKKSCVPRKSSVSLKC